MIKLTFFIKPLLIAGLLTNALPAYSADTMVTFKVPVKITNLAGKNYTRLLVTCGAVGNPKTASRAIPLPIDGNYEGVISLDVPFFPGARDWECVISNDLTLTAISSPSPYADMSKPQNYTVKGRL